ncbi:MAG: beta-ketoacyl-[acyl-carrier-protein] synthase II, partial [Treponema sp.]
STPANDKCETILIKQAFKEYAKTLKISSTKSETGHMIGAAGTMEALFCVKAIEDGFIPPTINLDNPDLENGCDLDYVPNKGIKMNVDAAMSCSLGFGGHNACVIIKKYKG